MKKFLSLFCASAFALCAFSAAGCADGGQKEVVLRVCSWEEYIDLGGWEEEDIIDIDNPFSESGSGITGENAIVDDFTEWFNENHDYKVRVEYSTFGTNEDLYNRLSLGDVYDLVCPSDYMIMKLKAEDKIQPYSKQFRTGEDSYYAKYVSEFIDGMFADYGWTDYAACYMWGTTGLVYNPEKIDDVADVSTWNVLLNEKYKRQVTIKDNVRDAYFATLGAINSEKLTGDISAGERSDILNDTAAETIALAQDALKDIKSNVYSFETDAGKSDMVTGKVIVNYQWSGDAVYIMDEAEGDENNPTELWYSVPAEGANLWFDGWTMLKSGINGNEQKQQAAEAFVNFLSRPDNAVRNMNYIGYTSAIAGDTVFDYLEWNYGAEEGAEVYEYDVSYFFGEGYTVEADISQFGFTDGNISRGRQLFAQYPSEQVKERSVVMRDFGERLADINKMWINVRCLDAKDISPAVIGIICGVAGLAALAVCLYVFRYRLFIKSRPKKGYEKVEK